MNIKELGAQVELAWRELNKLTAMTSNYTRVQICINLQNVREILYKSSDLLTFEQRTKFFYIIEDVITRLQNDYYNTKLPVEVLENAASETLYYKFKAWSELEDEK